MKNKTVLFAIILVALLLTSSFLVIWTSLEDEDTEFFVGVHLGGGGVDDCKALVDKVKNYTNLFVLSSGEIIENEDDLNEVCDYIYDAGLSFILYFRLSAILVFRYNVQSWLISAKEAYGDQFLGEYLCDEPGGNQMDGGHPRFSSAVDYEGAASLYNRNVVNEIEDYGYVGGEEFTSDYCLYWFDYKAGFDVVLVELAWNHSRPLNIALCRGAANVQNRDWGAMLTYTYRHPPYLASGPEIYEDLVLAYDSGAKYAVVFNYEENVEYSGYGILADEHFVALENFWTYMSENPDKHGSLKGEVVLVLPQDYGFGFRGSNDKMWGLWESDMYTKQLWDGVNSFLDEYGNCSDIVYSDPEFNDKLEDYYDDVILWSFGDVSSYPVQNLNSSLGYATIQEAIDAGQTSEGHIIFVKAGTYYENLVIEKSVTLMGEDRKTTVIDGGNHGTAVTIVGSNEPINYQNGNIVTVTYLSTSTNITGFTMRNGNSQTGDSSSNNLAAGLRIVGASYCHIVGNDIVDNGYGIYLGSSDSSMGYGMSLGSQNNVFRDNSLENNTVDFGFDSDFGLSYVNAIDSSNLINGKRVYYLVNEKDLVIDGSTFSAIGFLALVNCTGITVQNLVLDGGEGILLVDTTNSTFVNNSIVGGSAGIRLVSSSNNVLRDNVMSDNTYNFWVENGLTNVIDASNIVNGKPVYYWVNQQDQTVPSDAGYVALVNCSNILVQNVDISSNGQGVLLQDTSNSTVMGNRLSANYYGIQIEDCVGLNITGNELFNNSFGLHLYNSHYCEVSRNNIENNGLTGIYLFASRTNKIRENNIVKNENGIQIEDSNYIDNVKFNMLNQVVGNNITENSCGIRFENYPPESMFYHNNFIDNTEQVHDDYDFMSFDSSFVPRTWDNGREGNYWSDYVGEDTNNDGIADTPHQITGIANMDSYPLSGMVLNFNTSAGSVFVISNSTVEDFQYFEANHTIKMHVSDEAGFCRMVIPHTLMYPNNISVTLDSGLVSVIAPNYTVFDDGTQRWIYFAYPVGTQEITVTA